MRWTCPRVDSHCHFGGMIPPAAIAKILGMSLKEARRSIQMQKNEIGEGFDVFLSKFDVLNEILWNEDFVDMVVRWSCKEASKRCDHVNVSLSLNKYLDAGMDFDHLADIIVNSFRINSKRYNITTHLLLSMRYDSPQESQKDICVRVAESRLFDQFHGLDLVGNERYFDAEFYGDIVGLWKGRSKIIRAHVGEVPGTSENVAGAVEEVGVNRIAHGIFSDKPCIRMARDRGVLFDLALNSNLCTGVVGDLHDHPLPNMLKEGCLVTLSTDDPIVFDCSLDDEYKVAIEHGLINMDQAKYIMDMAYSNR